MITEELILLGSFLILSYFILSEYKSSKLFVIINGLVFLCYGPYLLYGLYNLSHGESGLSWFFYLLI